MLQFAVGGGISPLASVMGEVTATSMTALMALLFAASAATAFAVRPEQEERLEEPSDALGA